MKIVIERVTALPAKIGAAKGGGTTRVQRCQTADGVVHSGDNCIFAAARHLIARGVSPRAHLRFIRDDKVALTGRVEDFAALTGAGGELEPRIRKWSPHPDYPLAPALQAWWDARNPAGG